MNVLFLSPNFPVYNRMFAEQLLNNEVRVLGVGDAVYDSFSPEQKTALTEYYFVPSLEEYDAVYRAAAFYIHKYGRLDKIVSLNAHWLPLESALRRDFSVEGSLDAAPRKEKAFDVSYEAVLNGKGEPILAMNRVWNKDDGSYVPKKLNETVQTTALKAVKALGAKNDFVTVELKKAGAGYSVVNAFVAPAPFAPDIFNYAFEFDSYSAWAYMMTGSEVESTDQKHCITIIHAVDGREYPGISAEYFGELEGEMLQESPASDAMVNVGGDTVYLFTSDSEEKARGILSAFAGKEIPPFAAAKKPGRKPAAKAVKEESAAAAKKNSKPEKKSTARRGRKPAEKVKPSGEATPKAKKPNEAPVKEKTETKGKATKEVPAAIEAKKDVKTETLPKTNPAAKAETPKKTAVKAEAAKTPSVKTETPKAPQSAPAPISGKKAEGNKTEAKKPARQAESKPVMELNKNKKGQ